MRSTMLFGKAALAEIQRSNAGLLKLANASKIRFTTSPLPCRLSQDIIVKGANPRSRRRLSAAAINPIEVTGSLGFCKSR